MTPHAEFWATVAWTRDPPSDEDILLRRHRPSLSYAEEPPSHWIIEPITVRDDGAFGFSCMDLERWGTIHRRHFAPGLVFQLWFSSRLAGTGTVTELGCVR